MDKLADEIEIERLFQMEVLVKPQNNTGAIYGRLTTKFVRDWRKNLRELQWRLQRKMDA